MVKVYIIKAPYHPNDDKIKDILRELRMNLLRVHLEKESIRILLNAIKDNKVSVKNGSEGAGLINPHFKRTGEKLFRKHDFP